MFDRCALCACLCVCAASILSFMDHFCLVSTHSHEHTRRHIFPQEYSRVTCATMHKPSHLLVVGFSSGIFALYEVPAFVPIHTLRLAKRGYCGNVTTPP